ncbi:Coiled-coil domain-containing protein 6 [Hypsibius exemplaris]|uniref:Coiled-coil domain-containing protein 6 n=1 Tax=Hypsibius exemplaris TaxID=2072580 RepID=A0A1W0WVB1_HYPEX|nr:Coiled-coil domain-containing protein 6 [Hypsibius exemplaris]
MWPWPKADASMKEQRLRLRTRNTETAPLLLSFFISLFSALALPLAYSAYPERIKRGGVLKLFLRIEEISIRHPRLTTLLRPSPLSDSLPPSRVKLELRKSVFVFEEAFLYCLLLVLQKDCGVTRVTGEDSLEIFSTPSSRHRASAESVSHQQENMSDPSANGGGSGSAASSHAVPLSTSMSSASNFELDSASEWSDTSSLDGSMSGATTPILHRNFPPPQSGCAPDYSAGLAVSLSAAAAAAPTNQAASREQMNRLVERLQQENRVLKMEVDTHKMRIKSLQEENKGLRQQSVMIQVKAEQEEEFISNTLLKKIQVLKREKEVLAQNYEQEEECLTNDLSRKLIKLQREKVELESTLEKEQECLVNKLMRKVEKLEHDISVKQQCLEQLRREKGELENSLEQEQEALVNKLWIRMTKLEAEKRLLQQRLEQPIAGLDQSSAQPSKSSPESADQRQVELLKSEVDRMKYLLESTERDHTEKMDLLILEEKHMKEENTRLRRRLQQEAERREEICRNLSESESSLEIETEREFNESFGGNRNRTMSSPSGMNRKLSPNVVPSSHSATFPVTFHVPPAPSRVRQSPHRFATPSPLPPPSPMDTSDARSDHGGDMSGSEN